MCTAITFHGKHHYFGRNLDYEFSFGEKIIIIPRNFSVKPKYLDTCHSHYAVIGMGIVKHGYPLLFDGTNECGLSAAGLNFPDTACYGAMKQGQINVTAYEFILWVLIEHKDVKEVREKLEKVNITKDYFDRETPTTSLHWIIADREDAIVVEADKDGLHVYDNPAGVLTNNPTFPIQMWNLSQYRHLNCRTPENTFSADGTPELQVYSRGMGGIGLPGDLSSSSRFVRGVFTKINGERDFQETDSIEQFFHILGSVAQTKGCCQVEEEQFEFTVYSSCVDTERGIYYYTTYNNTRITGVDMNRENLSDNKLITYPLQKKTDFLMQNGG